MKLGSDCGLLFDPVKTVGFFIASLRFGEARSLSVIVLQF